MIMKIAFTGTHCTGKTTLLHDIEEIFSAEFVVNSVTEVARKIINRGYPLSMDANIDSYVHYINDQLNEEKEKMKNCGLFISDRTLLDPVAYAIVNYQLPRPYIPRYFIDMMKNVWLLEKEKYDLYVYFPVEFELEADGIRPSDEKYRKDIDKVIVSLLEEYNINYIKISGNRFERREYLSCVIKEHLCFRK